MFDLAEFAALLPPSGRLMGLDVGEKTIGVAFSDAGRSIATPRETIRRAQWKIDAARLETLIREENVAALVIGWPRNMNGTEGPRCQSVRQFAKNAQGKFNLPYLLWDERLSTTAVTRVMLDADLSRARRAEVVDKLAAAYILQGVLDGLLALNR